MLRGSRPAHVEHRRPLGWRGSMRRRSPHDSQVPLESSTRARQRWQWGPAAHTTATTAVRPHAAHGAVRLG